MMRKYLASLFQLVGGVIQTDKKIKTTDNFEAVEGVFSNELAVEGDFFYDSELQTIEKVVQMGDWNMTSSGQLWVYHGLTLQNIRGISGVLRNDGDSFYYPLRYSAASSGYGVKITSTNSSYTILEVENGGLFDNVNFNATGYNRGWMVYKYV